VEVGIVRAPSRGFLVGGITLALVLAAASCGDDTGRVGVAAPTGDPATTAVGSSTTAPAATATTSAPPAPDTTTTPQPEVTIPGSELVPVDPEGLLDAADLAELAAFDTVPLPTLLFDWAAVLETEAIVGPTGVSVAVDWTPYPEQHGPIVLQIGRHPLGPDPFDLSGFDSLDSPVRTYRMNSDVIGCGSPPGSLLVWDEGGYRYDLFLQPLAGCPGVDGFTVEQAVAIADSVVECTIDGTSLTCPEPPAA
jgi:hypothetical protein